MDKRKTYLIGLDTETCNSIEEEGKVDLSNSLVYDIGWAVCDKKANIYEKRSFIIKEIFCEMKDVMKSAYYAEKIPMYLKQIATGERKLVDFWTMRKTLLKDINTYGIKSIFAHNASFDLKALNNTIRWVSKSKFRYFFPKNIEIWDTLKMARQTIGKQKSYITFCFENEYLTKHKTPRVRLTAEILYRYITDDNDFIESHTGLEDVLIETLIMAHCFRQHKKMEKRLYA